MNSLDAFMQSELAHRGYVNLAPVNVLSWLKDQPETYRSVDPVVDLLRDWFPAVNPEVEESGIALRVSGGIGYFAPLHHWHNSVANAVRSGMVRGLPGYMNMGVEGAGADRDTLIQLFNGLQKRSFLQRLKAFFKIGEG